MSSVYVLYIFYVCAVFVLSIHRMCPVYARRMYCVGTAMCEITLNPDPMAPVCAEDRQLSGKPVATAAPVSKVPRVLTLVVLLLPSIPSASASDTATL